MSNRAKGWLFAVLAGLALWALIIAGGIGVAR